MATRRRERREDERQGRHQEESPAMPSSGNGTQLQNEAFSLLDAGRNAIDRALSQDSATYLRFNQQQGGQ